MADDEARPAEKAGARDRRRAAELRANLAKRKTQARARRDGEADARPDGIGTSEGDTEN